MSAETERVAQSSTDGAFLSLVEGEVQVVVDVFIQVVIGMVDGRRHDVVLHSQAANQRFDTAGSTEQVTRHRLRRADVQFVSVFAEELSDGLHFRDVAHGG